MWNALAHLAGPTLLTTAIAVLGTSVRAVFRYPHMWQYLEFRRRNDIRPSAMQLRYCRFGCYCRRTRQRGRRLCLTGQREKARGADKAATIKPRRYRHSERCGHAREQQRGPRTVTVGNKRGITSGGQAALVTLGYPGSGHRPPEVAIPGRVGGLSQGICEPHRNPTTPRHGGRSPQKPHGRNGTLRYTRYAC